MPEKLGGLVKTWAHLHKNNTTTIQNTQSNMEKT